MRTPRSLFVLFLLPASLVAQATLTPHQRAAREVYEQLVEINTVDSVGSVTTAVEAMAARFRAAGFPAADIHIDEIMRAVEEETRLTRCLDSETGCLGDRRCLTHGWCPNCCCASGWRRRCG